MYRLQLLWISGHRCIQSERVAGKKDSYTDVRLGDCRCAPGWCLRTIRDRTGATGLKWRRKQPGSTVHRSSERRMTFV